MISLRVISEAMRFAPLALALLACFTGSLFGAARAQQVSAHCSEEIFNVSQEMYQKFSLNLSRPEMVLTTDSANPFPGSYERIFSMITQYNSDSQYVRRSTFNAENFMNSTGIQLRLAKRVMEACPSTSKVRFGFANSSDTIDYYRMPSGQIREGIPIDCSRDGGNAVLQWGYSCS